MATTKTKKQPAKSKPIAVKRSAPRKTAANSTESFQVAPGPKNFMQVSLTTQTVYWLILAGVILVLGLWVVDLNDRVQNLYNDIDQSNLTSDTPATSTVKPDAAKDNATNAMHQ